MKTIIALIVLLFTLSSYCLLYAGDELILTAPKEVVPFAERIVVNYYQIVPNSPPYMLVNFDWKDTSGMIIKSGVQIVLSGQDFTDVFGFLIRAQDVGTPIGQGLKQLVWNKLKTVLAVDFQ